MQRIEYRGEVLLRYALNLPKKPTRCSGMLRLFIIQKRGEITKYKTIQGDTWDIIAKKVYGKEKYLDYLMKNNYELLEYFIFPAGIELNIPELPEETNSDLPKWR